MFYRPDMPRPSLPTDRKKVPLNMSVDAEVKENIRKIAGDAGLTSSAFINKKFKPKKKP